MPQPRIARHEFAASALASDAFRVVDFDGHEAISQPYRFEIHLVSDDPEIEFSDVINAPATLTMFRGDEPTEIDGIVIDFEQSGMEHGQSEYRYQYRAVLVPRLWRLALTSQSRVFQNLTVEEIVGKILADAGVDAQFSLSAPYEPRDYCTQYKESDLDFIQRLLEFEGIRYAFTHADGAETLHLSDDPGDAPPIAGGEALPYRHAAGLLSPDGDEFVGEFVARQQLVTGKTAVKDYNYRTPETPLEATSEINGDDAVGVQSDYGMNAGTGARATHLAAVRNEEIETTRLVMTGEGDCERFRAGHRFSLNDHYRDSLNQSYLLTGVHHWGGQAATGAEAQTGYRNSFSCVPASTPYRPPRRTPEPKLPGVLTARVESGGGEYAPIDDQGRYRVRMPFDQSDASKGQASKSIRLAQPYSGAGYGMHFPVHADAEMVFACVDGNIDRPLGLSTVPNPTQSSPVASENRTMNRIVTASDNRIEIEDQKGSERIKLYSPTGNSIVQIGAPNLPQSGIGISTDDSFQAYGAEGLVLKAGGPGGYLSDSAISDFKTGLTALDGALGVARAVAGGIATKSIGGALLGGIATIASTAAGIVWPGVYVYGHAGIGMYSPNGINALAGVGGMGLHSKGGTDLFALRGISLMNAAMGISIINGQGGIGIATGTGGIQVSARHGDVETESKDAKVKSKAATWIEDEANDSKLKMGAGFEIDIKGGRGIWMNTDDKYTVLTKGNISIRNNQDANMDVHTKDLVFETTTVKTNARSGFTVESGSSKLEITPSGIVLTVGASKVELKASGVTVNGTKVELEGTASLDAKTNGVLGIKGSLARIN